MTARRDMVVTQPRRTYANRGKRHRLYPPGAGPWRRPLSPPAGVAFPRPTPVLAHQGAVRHYPLEPAGLRPLPRTLLPGPRLRWAAAGQAGGQPGDGAGRGPGLVSGAA